MTQNSFTELTSNALQKATSKWFPSVLSDDWSLVTLINDARSDEMHSSTSSVSSQSGDVSQGSGKKRGRKRKFPQPIAILPRIPKTDLRRQYMSMMINVFNAGNFALTSSFMRDFYDPELVVEHGPIQTRGVSASILDWYIHMLSTPDAVYRIIDTRIVRTADSFVVEGSFVMDGTNLYDLGEVGTAVEGSLVPVQCAQPAEGAKPILVNTFGGPPVPVYLRARPFAVRYRGKISMVIHSSRKISQLKVCTYAAHETIC